MKHSRKIHRKKTMKKSSSKKKHMRKGTKRVKFNFHKRLNKGRNIKYKKMKGGSAPNPFVGYPWKGDSNTWPGIQASQGMNTNGATMSNHFSLSPNGIVVGGIEPARSTSDDQLMKGGKRTKRNKSRKGKSSKKGKSMRRHKKRQRGGLGVQSIVNLGRGIESNVKGVYYGFAGKEQPVSQNPYPTQGQYANSSTVQPMEEKSIDYRNMFIKANDAVAKI
jgi:hypothetical protein